MGAEANPSEMQVGLPITIICGTISMIILLIIIFHTIHQFRLRGYRIHKDIRRSSMAVFYSSFLLAFVQVLLWSGTLTKEEHCEWIVKFNVITLSLGKMTLYYLYTVRLDYTFRGTEWEIAPIILFFIRIAIVLVFGIVSVIMVVNISPGPTGNFDWGVYCNIVLDDAVIVVYGIVDFLITSYLLYLFSSKLYRVSQKVGSTLSKKDNALYHLVRLITVLTLISIVSSWAITCGYGVYKPIAWFTSIDFLFNSLLVFGMFEHIHLVDRIRFAGLLCCFCKIFWPKHTRQEYNDFIDSVEAQIEAKNELEIKKHNENNNNDPNQPLDVQVNGNNGKNSGSKKKVDTNTGSNGAHPLSHKSSSTTRDKQSPKLQPKNTMSTVNDNNNNDNNTNNKNSSKPNNNIQFLGANGLKGFDKNGDNMGNNENSNNNNENNDNIDDNDDDDDRNEKTQLTQMTRTEDLYLETQDTEANPEHSTPAEWTLASDVLGDNGQDIQQEELVAGDAQAVQQANQYAMEIMQLHANIDRF